MPDSLPPTAPQGRATWRRILRRFGPRMGRRRAVDILRSSLGAGLAILLCAVGLRLMPDARQEGLFLVSGFAAMAVLLFVLPNSPLAQPWPAVVGMIVSTTVSITVLRIIPPPFGDGVAVTLAIAAMLTVRALHPPAAGMALFCALEFEAGRPMGYDFVLMPVTAMTVALVLFAMVWNRIFGIAYPNRSLSPLPAPTGRMQKLRIPMLAPKRLREAELTALLTEFDQSANVAPADLERLFEAAQDRAAATLLRDTTVGQIMTRNPATIGPETPLSEIVRKMVALGVRGLPVTDSEGRLLGLVDQRAAMARLSRELSHERRRGLRPAAPEPEAQNLIGHAVEPLHPDTPVALLPGRLADHRARAIPVTEDDRLVGIVSRSDLVALLLAAAPGAPDAENDAAKQHAAAEQKP